MKTFRITTVIVLTIALLILGVAVVTAGPINTGNPNTALYINNQTQTIPGNSELWFKFNYDGDHTQVVLRIINAPDNLVVEVHNPATMGKWWDNEPIGVLSKEGDDLVWAGSSHESGTYFVQVTNQNPGAVSFTMTIKGESISLGPKTTGPAAPITAVTSPTAPTNTSPFAAVVFDNAKHTIPGNTSLWYAYRYTGGSDRNQISIKMINGNNSGMGFNLWTADGIVNWLDNEPIGRGTPSGDNLTWSGNFNLSGVYYIEVFNHNFYPLEFDLKVSGKNVLFAE